MRYFANSRISGRVYKIAREKVRHLNSDPRQVDEGVFPSFDASFEVVLLSVTSLEASINEIIGWYGTDFGGRVRFADCFTEAKLEDKWLQLPTCLNKATFDKSKDPWQSFYQLIRLRNMVIHYKWLVPIPEKLLTFFDSRKLLIQEPSDLGDAPSFVDAVFNSRTASWAVGIVPDMLDEITVLLGQEDNQMWSWSSRIHFKKEEVSK